MSEKDKKTIIIAVIALLIFGIIMLGIKPGITNLKEVKAQNAELSAKKQEMQTQIEALPTLKTQLETAKSDYKTTANRVFGDLDNDEIHDVVVDKLVTPLGLSISSFNVSGTDPRGMNTYAVSGDGTTTGGATEGSVKFANVTVNVYGSTDQVIAFIDELNETEGTYLQTVSFANSNNESAVTVAFYMVLSDTF